MTPKLAWTGAVPLLLIFSLAVGLTAWQAQVDRSVFKPYFGGLNPVAVLVGSSLLGLLAMGYLQGNSDFAVYRNGLGRDALVVIAWAVPLLAAAAIGADLVFRFPEDTNVAIPDALRFYPAIAVFVEAALHVVPIAVLVALVGRPTGINTTFWKIAIPVAAIEAVLQAVFATSLGTAAFSAVHLMVFGIAQVWMFWRFGFVWMLGFRLAYYSLWHLVWGAIRLPLLF